MDLDGDGLTDVLTGCYTHRDGSRDLMGEFYVLRGTKDGYAKPERLRGSDGKPLVIQARGTGHEADSDRMCTRPAVVDLNGDGHLDIVSGNESGLFALFLGGPDGFQPKSSWLTGTDGAALEVTRHSDPHFADWDGDGDLDLLSGSQRGGVSWFPNVGTAAAPGYGQARSLLPPVARRRADEEPRIGDAHIRGPQIATRVTTADFDGDGKLDLLVGDAVEIIRPAKGLSEDQCHRRLAAWSATLRKIVQSQPRFADPGNLTDEQQAAMAAFYERRSAHWDQRPAIIDKRSTGYVWLLRRK